MVTEVVETTVDMPVPLDRIWEALIDPATYARMFRGIGDCRPVVSANELRELEFRVGTLDVGVRRVDVRLILGRPYRDFELYCPALGSLASVRLGARPDHTHVVVTVFAPGRVHPAVPDLPNSAVSEWILAGLRRVGEGCAGARTAVVQDGTGAPVRRQVVVARQLLASGVSHRLFVAGRCDEMVISGGEKFFPRPVEEALEYLPQVREAAVVGVPDADFGQRMAAFVVKTEGSGLDAQMVRDYIRNRLARFAVPRDVSFIPALPRGETGKILERLLIMPNSGASQII